jgi:hypothetical protein
MSLKGGQRRPNDPVVSCPPPNCQANDSCTNPVKKGHAFCETHLKNGNNTISPLSGFEPNYNPAVYNRDKAVQHSHNCFAYAMRVYDKKKIEECRKQNDCKFHVPGKTKGHAEFSGQMGKTCSDVLSRTMADIPSGYVTNFETVCNPNYSKVAIVVDEINDLHYYSEDDNGTWSHKPGGRPVTNKDAYGAKIYRPDRASRCYPRETPEDSGLNYDSFCSYMCVPRNKPILVAGGGHSRQSRQSRRSRQSRQSRQFRRKKNTLKRKSRK